MAKPALDEMRHMASQVQMRWEDHQRRREDEEAAAAGAADAATLEEIRRFFERRQKLQQERQGMEGMQTGMSIKLYIFCMHRPLLNCHTDVVQMRSRRRSCG